MAQQSPSGHRARRTAPLLATLVLACIAPALGAQGLPTAFVGARILPIGGEPIPNGTLLVTAQRHTDIITALRLAEEFELRLVLDGATEAYLVLEEIRSAKVPVIIHPTMMRAWGEMENLALGTAARLLGIDSRLGSLEVGKDGDLALYDGDPLEYTTHCVGTIIEDAIVSEETR